MNKDIDKFEKIKKIALKYRYSNKYYISLILKYSIILVIILWIILSLIYKESFFLIWWFIIVAILRILLDDKKQEYEIKYTLQPIEYVTLLMKSFIDNKVKLIHPNIQSDNISDNDLKNKLKYTYIAFLTATIFEYKRFSIWHYSRKTWTGATDAEYTAITEEWIIIKWYSDKYKFLNNIYINFEEHKELLKDEIYWILWIFKLILFIIIILWLFWFWWYIIFSLFDINPFISIIWFLILITFWLLLVFVWYKRSIKKNIYINNQNELISHKILQNTNQYINRIYINEWEILITMDYYFKDILNSDNDLIFINNLLYDIDELY